MKSKEAFNLEKFQDQFSALIFIPLTERARHLVPNRSKISTGLEALGMNDSLSLGGLETYNRNYWYKLLGNLHSTLPLVSHYIGLWDFNKIALKWFSKEFYLSRDLGVVPPTFMEHLRNHIHSSYTGDRRLLLLESLSLDLAWYELFKVPFKTSKSEVLIPAQSTFFHLKENIRILFDSFGLWEKRFLVKENMESKMPPADLKSLSFETKSKKAQCIIMKSQNLTVNCTEVDWLHGLFLEKMNHQTVASGVDQFSQALNPDQLRTAELSIHHWIKYSLEHDLWDFEN